jgi:pyruvate dehydrogenase E1 component beta subunit
MLWTAILDPDPVIIFEHAMLYNDDGEVAAEGDLAVDIDRAAVRRAGGDATSSPMAGA